MTEEMKTILSHVDHTCLSPTATRADILHLCEEGRRFGVASVCLPPRYVRTARDFLGGAVRVCTVIGFPCGYATTESKAAETADAVRCGADEIDMVIPLGPVKEGDDAAVLRDIAAVRRACADRVLKVIVETCYLTDEEKIRLCGVVARSGADYIKTSTGFGPGGATREDILLFAAHCPPALRIKAAGGISTWETAADLLRCGADRLGSSRLVALAKQYENEKGETR